jgi:TPR repeat protein
MSITNLEVANDCFQAGDLHAAKKFYEMAAAEGSKYALIGLALALVELAEQPDSGRQAINLLRGVIDDSSANDRERALAAHNAGTLMMCGAMGLSTDVDEAERLYQRAKELGFSSGP